MGVAEGIHHAKVAINEFADLTNEEFKKFHLGLDI